MDAALPFVVAIFVILGGATALAFAGVVPAEAPEARAPVEADTEEDGRKVLRLVLVTAAATIAILFLFRRRFWT